MQNFAILTAGGFDMAQIGTFLPIVLVFVVFYFFLIRPEQKRKKQLAVLRDNLSIGDDVTTIGGIVGKITAIKDDTFTIETGGDRNKIKIMRWAISTRGDTASAGESVSTTDQK